jgi:hypothetical protein
MNHSAQKARRVLSNQPTARTLIKSTSAVFPSKTPCAYRAEFNMQTAKSAPKGLAARPVKGSSTALCEEKR